MKNPFNIFALRNKPERWLALVSALVFGALNALLVYAHWDRFTMARHGHVGAWWLLNNQLHFSGYDPYAYMMLTQYTAYYEINRHPIYTFFFWPLYQLNHWIMVTFDFNAAPIIIGVLITILSTYTALFTYRTLKEVMGLGVKDSMWLTALFFSFASVLTAAMSPDHFIVSAFLLTLTLYVFGKCLRDNKPVEWWKGAVLYLLTAGVTLTNGVKTLLGGLFVDGKKTFQWKNIVLAFCLPTLLLMAGATAQYYELALPRAQKSAIIVAKTRAKDPSLAKKDSINKILNKKISGEQLSDKPFLKYISVSVLRTNGIVEGLFGESIQLHRDYLLGDIYLGRPAVVHYRSWFNYVVNALVAILFFAGIVVGRKRRIIQMLLSWWAVDLLIHIVLGFGCNEVYINGAHWMFFIPVAIACLYTDLNGKWLQTVKNTTMLLTVYLLAYNGTLIVEYLLH